MVLYGIKVLAEQHSGIVLDIEMDHTALGWPACSPLLLVWKPGRHEYTALDLHWVLPFNIATAEWGSMGGSPQEMRRHWGALPVHWPEESHNLHRGDH